jgi:hypothetical protein
MFMAALFMPNMGSSWRSMLRGECRFSDSGRSRNPSVIEQSEKKRKVVDESAHDKKEA